MRELADLQIGKTLLKFDAIEGVVVNEKKWSETHVHSYGGGAYSGPSVHSRNTTRHEVWIKQHGSGEETQLDLSDCGVETREGQEVAAVAVNIGDEKRYVLFVNRTAKQSFSLVSSFKKMVTPLIGERPTSLFPMVFLLGLLACFGGFLAQDFFGSAYDFYRSFREMQRTKLVAEAFNIPPEKYRQLDTMQRIEVRKLFELNHQEKLLGINALKKLGRAEWAGLHKLTQEKFGVPASYFYIRGQSGVVQLSPEKEDALFKYLYGYPRDVSVIEREDFRPRPRSDSYPPLAMGTGAMIFVGGLFLTFRRRDSNNLNIYNASDALASHINGLGSQLLGNGNQKG